MNLLVLLCVLGAASAWKNYDGYQLLEVTPETKDQIEILRDLMLKTDDYDFWLEPVAIGRAVQVLVKPELNSQFKTIMRDMKLDITTIHENLRDVVGDEPMSLSVPENRDYDYLDYNRHAEFMTEIDNLATNCAQDLPDVVCSTEVIGNSFEGRELKILKIDTNAENNFWIDSCIHAREWLACATVMNIVNKMLTNTSAPVREVLMSHNWYILPVFNPDGYEYTWTNDRFWRKCRAPNDNSACIGTDLNRNHDFMWATGGSSSSPCSDTYHGPSAASQVEVNAVETYVSGLESLRGFLTFHTTGQYWLVPYGDCTDDEAFKEDTQAVADATCDAIEATYGTTWLCGNSCRELYATSGTTADWAMGARRVKYSYTPELRGPGFNPPPSAIPPSVDEIWNGMVAKINAIKEIEGS